jgi:hypothetical protein
MKKLLSIILLTASLFAQANNIFTINPSVYSASIGNAGIADASVKNLFHNPAFAGLKQQHSEVSYVKWLPNLVDDMGYQNLSYTSNFGFTSELFYFDYGTQTQADPNGIIVGDFQSSSLRVGLGYGLDLKGWLFGARLNLYQHQFIDDVDIGMNYGLDVGVHKQFNNTSLGIVLKDLGGETEFLDEKLALPMSIGLGIKQSIPFRENITYNILLDVKMYEDWNSIGIGDELVINDMFYIRGGYYTEPDFDVDYITLGGGIDIGFINIDLAYLFNEESFHNETVMLSFGFDF